MSETNDLHHRITTMEKDVREIKDWKANVSTIIGGLGDSMKTIRDDVAGIKTTNQSQNVVLDRIDKAVRGDIDGKEPGIHATLMNMKQFVSGIKTVLWVIARTLLVALVGGLITAGIYLVRHTGP